MQRKRISFPNRGTSPEKEGRTTISLDEWSSTLKQFLHPQLVASPWSTSNIRKYSVKKSCKDYPITPSGTMPLNYYQGPQHHYQDDSSL